MFVDLIFPIAGILCIILCIIYFFRGLHDSDRLMQEIRLEKIGVALKLSSIPFMLLFVSLFLIGPTIYFRYYGFKELSAQINALRSDLDRRDATIENGKLLIREIQNCTVPVYIMLEGIDTTTEPPYLDNMTCELNLGGERVRDVIIARGLEQNQYKILLQQVDCNNTIRRLEIRDAANHRAWVARDITPCEYVVKNLVMAKK